MVLCVVASRDSTAKPRPRSRVLVGGFGLVALVALVAAYLSDCLPGLGAGSSLGTPASEPPAAPAEPAEPASAAGQPARLSIVVEGDRCRYADAAPAPCPEVCAALPLGRASTAVVEIEAVQGRHGTVEDLRQCLVKAGFANVRVHAE